MFIFSYVQHAECPYMSEVTHTLSVSTPSGTSMYLLILKEVPLPTPTGLSTGSQGSHGKSESEDTSGRPTSSDIKEVTKSGVLL